MAGTLFKALSAIGLKTTAFLQSLFLFPYNVVLQAVDLLPFTRQTRPPLLPRSVSGSDSTFPSSFLHTKSGSSDAPGVMTTASSSAASTLESRGQEPTISEMASTLPRVPTAAKENGEPGNAANDTVAQLAGQLSQLELDEAGTASNRQQSVVNGTGKTIAESGASETAAVQNGVAPQKPLSSHGLLSSDDAAEVTRQLPVPLTQISTPKDPTAATIQLNGETVFIQPIDETPEQAAERAMHSRFMRDALDMARLALKTNETPVGCVLVYRERVIARGMNATNVTRNGTRHAELMAISALLSYVPASDLEPATNGAQGKPPAARTALADKTNQPDPVEEFDESVWGDVDPRDGHLYPYGQKLHPSPRVDPSVIRECTLYVTVEPCVMCASLLRQLGIKKVYFGAVNDKFGGTGGVFRIHKNSPHSMASAPPTPVPQVGKGLVRPVLERRPASTDAIVEEEHNPMEHAGEQNSVVASPLEQAALPGDGGNIERGYEAEGGWGRDEAVTLLRQFYVQENNRAPVPRKKEGRAARLAAMMERDGGPAGAPASESNGGEKTENGSGASTPALQEQSAEGAPEADVEADVEADDE